MATVPSARAGDAAEADAGEVFPQLKIGRFTAGGRTIAFPVTKVAWTFGNRLVERERPYRDGAKVDDTGSKADRFCVEVLFENSIQEPGLETNGMPLYPDAVNELMAICRVHVTGDLELPDVDAIRARCLDIERIVSADIRDAAAVRITFVADNEDHVGARSIQAPSPKANARRLALAAEFDAQRAEVWDFNVRTLNTLVSQIETTLNRPHEVVQDTQLLAFQIRSAADRVRRAFTQFGVDGRDTLGQPRGHHVQRKLVDQEEMAGRAQLVAQGGKPTLIVLLLTVDSSIFQVAAELHQPVEDLIRINPQLPDPCDIPKGTRVRVFANAA